MISLSKRTTEMNCKRSVRHQLIWPAGGCCLLLALWLSLQAASTPSFAAANQRRIQQQTSIETGHLGSREVDRNQGGATKQRQINWVPAAHSNSQQPQVAASGPAASSIRGPTKTQDKSKKAELQQHAGHTSDKLMQLNSLMNVAAQAARVGALVSDVEQQQKRHKSSNSSSQGVSVIEFEPHELAKSMQMMSAAVASVDPPPSQVTGKTPTRRIQAPKMSARQQASGLTMLANETSDEFASSFDDQSPSLAPNQILPLVPETALPGSMELDEVHQVHQVHQVQQQQHSVLEHDPEQRPQLEHEQHEHPESHHHHQPAHLSPTSSLLNDFHLINSLPNALQDDHHYHSHHQQKEYSHAASPRADSSGYSSHPTSHSNKAGSIRVVFNNNPHFIIGSNARELPSDYLQSASNPLQRKTRQPSSAFYGDYNQDESAPDESKVVQSKISPCADKTHHHHEQQQYDEQVNELPKYMEKIDTKGELPPQMEQKSLPPPTKTQVMQQVDRTQEQVPLEPREPPVVKSRPPPAIKTQQQQQQPVDEQVITPFDQIVKSGLRPPLRMVISMRNKQGDVMKVPINFHGSAHPSKIQQQEPVDPFPQMQIRFEKPVVEQVQQVVRDENTPIGGDIFDPALNRPFGKTSPGKRPTKTSDEPPPQQQEKAPIEPEIKTQMHVRSKEEPATKSPPITRVFERPPVKAPPQVQQVQQAEREPPVPVVQTKTEPAPQKKPDCQQKAEEPAIVQKTSVEEPPIKQQPIAQLITREQPEQQQQEEQHQIVLPISSNPNDGIVQMLMPKLTQFQNKTFASMFTQFQQALSEHMTNHLASEQQKEATEQRKARPNNSKIQDEQEDLMVALMAANMNQRDGSSSGAVADRAQTPLSMTVIKPPKGTSLEEAIRSHAKAGQTMAILGSPTLMQSINRPQGGQRANSGSEASSANEALPVGVDVVVRPMPGGGQRADQPPRTRPSSAMSNANPASDEREIDPDGFSSSASSADSSQDFDSSDQVLERSLWAQHVLGRRFKRSAPAADEKSTSLPEVSHLDPEDKLANRTTPVPVSKQKRTQQRQSAKSVKQSAETARQKSKTLARPMQNVARVNKTQSASRFSKRVGSFRPLGRLASNANQQEQERGRAADQQRRSDEKDFQTAGSHVNEVSSEPSSDESDEDGDEDESGDGPDSSAPSSNVQSSSSADHEEPSASASGEGDDSDYTGDLGDDFDDSASASNFDSDDEPYNQAAASDRDYSGASSSFEIPAIDINPNTLQQKGCRTVLREVQEIPMNGLGVVQANGQPGSGFASADASSVGSLRVRRQAPNENLINSRKVTSIVMTKECHFPNDGGSSDKDAAASISKRAKAVSRSPDANKPARIDPNFGNQGGASQTSATVMHQQQQQQPRQVIVQNYPAYQLLKEPQQQLQQQPQAEASARPEVASFYQPAGQLLVHQAARPQNKPISLQQQPIDQQQQLMALANFYASQRQGNNGNQQRPRQQVNGPQQQLQSSASTIKRRSVSPMPMQRVGQLAASRDVTESAASGVIAHKLYKPPSEDDPYHTLSYSSQTGADPDMEQDEDDSVVMGADGGEQQDSAESGRNNERRPRVSSSQGTLSERERAALMDPNHDDTDPESDEEAAQKRMAISSSDQRNNKQQQQGAAQNLVQASEDADENDGDLTDESRPARQLRQASRSPVKQQQRMQPSKTAPVHGFSSQRAAPGGFRSAQARQRPPPAPRSSDRRQEQSGSGSLRSAPARRAAIPAEAARFVKSFKFEHELSRVGPTNARATVGGHLRQLKPGLQGYVAKRGEQDQRPVARPVQNASQLRSAVASTVERRSDGDEDESASDDADEDDHEGRASSGKRRLAGSPPSAAGDEDSEDDDENPDADPELNPRESHLPAHSKPKRFEKSFAYVHRDLPKKGARNPDDFVVSYGRGNLQTEHEDYDSDRDQNAAPSQEAGKRDRAAAASGRRPQVAAQPIPSRRPNELQRLQQQRLRQ